ncbi:MAG: hypothetical protein J6L87_00675 [Clostridia bacterium]|nr:hypothetical protein [Clostridia bacterium]
MKRVVVGPAYTKKHEKAVLPSETIGKAAFWRRSSDKSGGCALFCLRRFVRRGTMARLCDGGCGAFMKSAEFCRFGLQKYAIYGTMEKIK